MIFFLEKFRRMCIRILSRWKSENSSGLLSGDHQERFSQHVNFNILPHRQLPCFRSKINEILLRETNVTKLVLYCIVNDLIQTWRYRLMHGFVSKILFSTSTLFIPCPKSCHFNTSSFDEKCQKICYQIF